MSDFFAALRSICSQGFLRPIDVAFADLIYRLHNDKDVAMAAALASAAVAEGHVCLYLPEWAGGVFPPAEVASEVTFHLPALGDWKSALYAAKAVVSYNSGKNSEIRPLVLAGDRLYLRRYWEYEQRVAAALRRMANAAEIPPASLRDIPAWLDNVLAADDKLPRLACVIALTRRLLVLSGGPGTGKTYTAARIAALLQAAYPDFCLRLAAPTGKAANRLRECLSQAADDLPPALAAKLHKLTPAVTIHRLLGAGRSRGVFHYSRHHPLPADAVIIDEASMLPLSLFAALLAALKPTARLILIGDHRQLAAVEAGSVLADICDAAGNVTAVSASLRQTYAAMAGAEAAAQLPQSESVGRLADTLVILQASRRFPPSDPLGSLVEAVLAANAPPEDEEAAKHLRQLSTAAGSRIHWVQDNSEAPAKICQAIRQGYAPLLRARTPIEALEAMRRFRILCAVRHGHFGVSGMNSLAVRILSAAEEIEKDGNRDSPRNARLLPDRRFYKHQPLMVTTNCYGLNLLNGELGVVMPSAEGGLYAYFAPAGDVTDEPRAIPVNLLPACETAFATTVHKAQGSEFENLLIVLPFQNSPLLTKELLYTALTRIKPDPQRPEETGQIIIWCSEKVFRSAVLRRTARISGLVAALRQTDVE